jgi:type II secretory pathway pseudopilin PulG
MKERGLSLVETLLALALLGGLAMAVMPAFISQMDANTRNQQRTDAIALALERLEELRFTIPSALPTSGSDSRFASAAGRSYEIRTHYCQETSFCPPTQVGVRHLTIEVWLDGREVYDVATVYTELR